MHGGTVLAFMLWVQLLKLLLVWMWLWLWSWMLFFSFCHHDHGFKKVAENIKWWDQVCNVNANEHNQRIFWLSLDTRNTTHFAGIPSSGLPKAEGLQSKSKVSHLRLCLWLPKVYAADGRRSSRRLKLLKFSKSKCKFCDKNFRMIKAHVFSVFEKV